jgi:outer membrane protein assembly factor BamB
MFMQRGLIRRVMPATAPPPKNHGNHGKKQKRKRVVQLRKTEVQKPISRNTIYRGDLHNSGVYRTVPARFFPDKGNWVFRSNSAIVGTPVITDTSVLFGNSEGLVLSLDRATGTEQWRFDSGSPIIGSPTLGNGLVLFNSGNRLFGIEADTGEPSPWNESWSALEVYSSPRVAGHRVYIGGHELFFALSLLTGEPIWVWKESATVFETTPIVHKGVLYAVGYDAEIIGVEARTGHGLWTVNRENSWTTGGPVLHEGRLYCQVMDTLPRGGRDEFTARILNSCDVMTRENPRPHTGLPQDIRTSPAFSGGKAYFGTLHGAVYAVDPMKPTVEWQFLTRGPVLSAPSIAGDLIHFGSDDGHLYVLDKTNGSLIARFRSDAGSPIRTSPAIWQGAVYFGDEDGNLYSWGRSGAATDSKRSPRS